MKTNLVKYLVLSALTTAALAGSASCLADGPYVGALGAGTANFTPTDVYRLVCPAGTATVRARAVNPNGNPVDEIATTIISAATGAARTVIALEGGIAPTAILPGGAGVYYISLHKDAKLLAARYSLTLDCYSTGAAIAGIQTVMRQNH